MPSNALPLLIKGRSIRPDPSSRSGGRNANAVVPRLGVTERRGLQLLALAISRSGRGAGSA